VNEIEAIRVAVLSVDPAQGQIVRSRGGVGRAPGFVGAGGSTRFGSNGGKGSAPMIRNGGGTGRVETVRGI